MTKRHQFAPDADGGFQVDSCIYCGDSRKAHADTAPGDEPHPRNDLEPRFGTESLIQRLRSTPDEGWCGQCTDLAIEAADALEKWQKQHESAMLSQIAVERDRLTRDYIYARNVQCAALEERDRLRAEAEISATELRGCHEELRRLRAALSGVMAFIDDQHECGRISKADYELSDSLRNAREAFARKEKP